MLAPVNDSQVGSVIRAVRIKRGMTQSQVAAAAGISRPLLSRLEAGDLESTSLRIIRRVGAVLAVALPFDPRWRGADLARLLDERHAGLVRAVVERLAPMGWQCLPEHTFNEWGERGSIDVFAWHERNRAVLCLEIKTRLVDLQDLLSVMDRKRRLAPSLALRLGWRATAFGSVLVLPEEGWARNAVERQRAIFDARFPARTLQVRRWLKGPAANLGGIWFLADDTPGDAKGRFAASRRVRVPRSTPNGAAPRSDPPATPPTALAGGGRGAPPAA